MNDDWIKDYWDYMVAANFEKAIPLKAANFPKSFYKYKGLTLQGLEGIRENYIWLAEISSLNDPFECSLQFDNDACLRLYFGSEKFQQGFARLTGQSLKDNEIISLSNSQKPFDQYLEICKIRNIPYDLNRDEQLNKSQQRWSEIVEEINQNLTICSFTLKEDSLLLWSHYADQHKGICIEYDFPEFNVIRAFIQPTNYRQEVHKIQVFEEFNAMQAIASSLIKSNDWSYEKEWRITIFKSDKNFVQKLPVPVPKAIFLGTRFHLNDKNLKDCLFSIAAEKQIALYQMEKDSLEFRLIHKTRFI
jgi:Protein of unknown function (DUF2971)